MAKETNKRINIWINGKEVENNVKSIRSAMSQLTNQLNKMEIGSAEYIETSKKLRELKGIYDEHCKSLRLTNNEYHVLSSNLKENILVTGGAAAVIQTASKAVQSFVAATQEYVQAYATLDDAMSAVQKTTGMTREEVEALHNSLKNIDTRTSTEELLKIAEIGGRLGLAKEDIEAFTKSVDVANVALGDSFAGGAEEIATVLGKIRGAFKTTKEMDIESAFNSIGSALNSVGASSAATEGNVAQFTQRIGALPEAMKPSIQEAIGLGAAFENASINAEVASTAYGQLMTKAAANIEKFAEVMGRPVDEIRELLNTNPVEFMLQFSESMKGVPADQLGSKLKDLKLNAVGVQEAIGAMSGQTDEFRRILSVSSEEFAKGTSMMEEFGTVNNNAAAQLEKAKKAVEDAKAALGEELMPVITQITQSSATGLKIAKEVIKFAIQHKGLVIALAIAYGALLLAQKAVNAAQKEGHALTLKNMAVGKAYRSVVFLLTAAKAKLAGATGAATLAQKQFKAAFASTPWGAIIVAIGAVVGGIVKLVEKHREARKAAEEFNEACSKEQAEAEYLFQKLKKAERGTKEYEEALQQLKEKYPEIISKHIDEEGRLRDIEQAYKDVITQIQAKIALDMREKQNTDTIAKHTSEQLDLFNKLRKRLSKDYSESQVKDMMDAVQTMTKAGENSDAIFKSLQDNYGYTYSSGMFGIKGILTDITEEQRKMTEEVDATNKQFDPFINNLVKEEDELDEIARIDAQIATLQKQIYGAENRKGIRQQIEDLKKLKQQKLENKKADSGNSPGSSEETDPKEAERKRKKILQDRDAFEKKLAQMRTKEQTDLLTGWEKTKQQIIDKYKEMEDEAVKLYGENSQMLKGVQAQRDQAIAEAGQKYIRDTSKILIDTANKILEWQKEVDPGNGNEIIDKLLGKKAEWVKRASDLQTHLEMLRDTRRQFIADNVDTSAIDAEITRTEDYLAKISTMQVADLKQFIEQYQKEVFSFITTEQEDLTNSTMTETQRQKAAITEKYRLEIELIEKLKAARRKAMGEDADISDLEEQINKLIELRDKLLANVDQQSSGGLQGKNIWQQLAEFDWKNMGDNWQQGLDLMTNALNEFANTALSIFNSISQMQSNAAQAEFEAYSEAQDRKSKALKKQLDSGLISKAKYDAQVAKMEEEKEKKEKEMKHEQFEREKTANIIQTIISGAAAAATTLAQWGVPWGLIPMGIALAMTAVETALIASQPNPYARGGFIRGKQIAMMGEEGDEWVASHMLLSDKKTAPVISALEKYQQGDSRALDMLSVPEPNWEKLQQSSRKLSRTFASSTPVNNYYYTNSNNTTTSDNSELLAEIRQMNSFLKDPKNRQAVISRKIQLEFERFEDDVRQRARL